MHEPEIYDQVNKGARIGTSAALDQVGHLFRWKSDHSDTILDVGCGPGNVLMNIVLPRFKGKYRKCYATDISQRMVDYASKKYPAVDDVEFLQMDIMDVDGFLSKHEPVDHVVSSFVVHFVRNQDIGLQNIFKLLKPGGDFFTVHCRDTAIFDLYKHMDENDKWNKYLDNLKEYIPFSHTSSQPEQDLREKLEQIGFCDVVVELKPNNIHCDSVDDLKVLFSSILLQIHNIPEEKRSEYLDDFVNYGINEKLFLVDTDGQVSFTFNLFVVHARKPW